MKKNVIKTLPFVFFLIGMLISCDDTDGEGKLPFYEDPYGENPNENSYEEKPAEIKVSYNAQPITNEGRIENVFNDIYANTNEAEFGELTITIRNGDSSDLYATRIRRPDLRLTGAGEIIKLSGATGVFKVSSQPAETVLKQGESTTLTLRFKPTNSNLVDFPRYDGQ